MNTGSHTWHEIISQPQTWQLTLETFSTRKKPLESFVMCIAAPVFDHKGIVAAISAAGPSDRMGRKLREEHLEQRVKEAAGLISSRIGWMYGV